MKSIKTKAIDFDEEFSQFKHLNNFIDTNATNKHIEEKVEAGLKEKFVKIKENYNSEVVKNPQNNLNQAFITISNAKEHLKLLLSDEVKQKLLPGIENVLDTLHLNVNQREAKFVKDQGKTTKIDVRRIASIASYPEIMTNPQYTTQAATKIIDDLHKESKSSTTYSDNLAIDAFFETLKSNMNPIVEKRLEISNELNQAKKELTHEASKSLTPAEKAEIASKILLHSEVLNTDAKEGLKQSLKSYYARNISDQSLTKKLLGVCAMANVTIAMENKAPLNKQETKHHKKMMDYLPNKLPVKLAVLWYAGFNKIHKNNAESQAKLQKNEKELFTPAKHVYSMKSNIGTLFTAHQKEHKPVAKIVTAIKNKLGR